MASDGEIGRMRKLLEQNGYDGDYCRSVSTRPQFSQSGIPEVVYIFTLKGGQEGKEAYLWRNDDWTGEQPYGLGVQTDDIKSWQDAISRLITNRIPKD